MLPLLLNLHGEIGEYLYLSVPERDVALHSGEAEDSIAVPKVQSFAIKVWEVRPGERV